MIVISVKRLLLLKLTKVIINFEVLLCKFMVKIYFHIRKGDIFIIIFFTIISGEYKILPNEILILLIVLQIILLVINNIIISKIIKKRIFHII